MGCERLHTQSVLDSPRRRVRRRGPRSIMAIRRRLHEHLKICPAGETFGQAEIISPNIDLELQPLNMLVCNVQSLLGKIEELVKMIEDHDIQIVLVQETWLDTSIPNPHISNFHIIFRRDRSERPNRGGIITLARCDINNMVFLKHSCEAERSWHLLHRDSGSIGICNWYLPPASSLEKIDSIRQELHEVSEQCDTSIVLGDLNIHHKSWLQFSREDTAGGRHLQEI